MAKKKILYVITKANWGGAQRYVFDLATSLPKERFEVVVAAGRSDLNRSEPRHGSAGAEGGDLLLQKLQKAKIRTIAIPYLERDINIFKELFSLFSLFKIFKNERPDIIHLNSSKIGGLGAVVAFVSKLLTTNYKLKTIFTVHGWGFHEPRLRWQNKLIIFSSRLASLFQNHLIHVSKADLAATHALGIAAPEKTEYIPLGAKNQRLLDRARAREFFQKNFNLNTKAIWIGTVAELTKNKGLNYLIDAVNQMNFQFSIFDFQFLIIGEGEDKEKLQEQIKRLGLENTIYLAGFIPKTSRYLKAFDIFVLPSLKEGLPYTLLEAMRAGTPVIATSIGGIQDVIEHGKNGLLAPPANSAAIAEALTTLIKNPDKLKELGENAAKKIRECSSFPEMIQRHINLYEA